MSSSSGAEVHGKEEEGAWAILQVLQWATLNEATPGDRSQAGVDESRSEQ